MWKLVPLSTVPGDRDSFVRLQHRLSRSVAQRCFVYGFPLGPLTRVIQTGIGLAAELKAASKERKAFEVSADESLIGELGVPFQLMD